MKIFKFTILLLAMIVSGCGVSPSVDPLYDGFRNPPVSTRPFARWSWDVGSPTEKEILRRLDAVKKDGFGGVEIYPAEDINIVMLKFAADAAKKRGLLIDLSLSSILAAPYLQPDESSRMITLGKKTLSGPSTYTTTLNEILHMPDETRPVARKTRRRLMFLRLIPQGLNSFQPGIKPIDKINPYGSNTFDVPDGEHSFYVGILHENAVRLSNSTSNVPVLDVLNRQAVEKYFGKIFSDLSNVFEGRLGDSIHAISCDNVNLFGANWTDDFAEQFLRRRRYDVLPYLPVILDNTLPKQRTRFYDTTRRVRYDFCLTFAELFNENFVRTFRDFCRDNGVLSRLNIPDVNMLLTLRGLVGSDSMSPDIPLYNAPFPVVRDTSLPYPENCTGCKARLSYLFQNSTRQSRIAVLFPTVDIFSDCGLYGFRCEDYFWYLSGLWQALNHNGFSADYINEQVLSQSTYEDGSLHLGSSTWDAVIVPDVCSIEFPAARILRLFARAGGKIALLGGYPMASPGFKDLLQRTIPVQITMEHIREENPDRAVVFLPPQKNKDNLTSWAAELTRKLGGTPDVRISPPNDNLLFVHYAAGNRDIFFFTNTSRYQQISFNAQFNTADKIPAVWDLETGARRIFPYGGNNSKLDIRLKPLESLLLVFEPDSKSIP